MFNQFISNYKYLQLSYTNPVQIYMLIIALIIVSCSISLAFSSQHHKYQNCTQLSFIPMPQKISCNINDQTKQQLKQPCDIEYIIYAANQHASTKHIKQLIRYQMYKTFKCRSVRFGSQPDNPNVGTEMIVQVQIKDAVLKSAFTIKQQAYSLSIARERSLIQAQHYVGFVRGLQTFLQSITCNKYFKQCYMIALPIHIEDEPLFVYRGILIDTSRHFLPIRLIKETIDAMMYNKFNILHWHIVDEDSFPLILKSHPELAEYAAFSMYETYSTEEVKQIIQYAMLRGVRIIPEIDSPGHAASWAKAPENFDVACTLIKSKYRGPLDVTLDKTYKFMREIFAEVFELFPDPYIHLGGDQVQLTCLQNKTQFVQLQNITQAEIQLQYRKKQKKILKQLNSSKTFIYWQYDKMVQVEQDDIIHWWGRKAFVPASTYHNKIILSPSFKTGEFYIDMGVGGPFGTPYHMYSTWFDMYKINVGKEITAFSNKDDVIGCVVTLWSQVSNIYTHHSKIWIRSSAIAERAWTSEQHNAKPDFLRRLVAHEKLMNRRGISTSPATCQYCEKNPQFC